MSITLMIAVALDIILICIGAHIIFLTHRIKQKVDYKRSKVYSKYKVITLCGSTKFKKEFEQITKELTLKGYIVISVGLFGHCGDNEVWTGNTKRMLDKMHKAKIDLADIVVIVNKDNYIGESTQKEIEYAKESKKQIHYYYHSTNAL